MSAVEAVEVTKKYKGSLFFAIKNISLDIEPGRIFTFLGKQWRAGSPILSQTESSALVRE